LTATQVLWTTIKAHQFMEAYSRRNFFEHPSISAVIARHLASHHVRPNASIEDKVRKMEAALVKFSSRVDSIESRLNSFDSKHDNLKASLKEALKDIQEQKNAQSPLRKPRGGQQEQEQWEGHGGRTRPGMRIAHTPVAAPTPILCSSPSLPSPPVGGQVREGFLQLPPPSAYLPAGLFAVSATSWPSIMPALGFRLSCQFSTVAAIPPTPSFQYLFCQGPGTLWRQSGRVGQIAWC
jgi:hypothetical protein